MSTPAQAEPAAFEVHLPQFEGPLDLLLFFIQRDELDIQDIPIASITHDFLDYLHHAERLHLNLAAEFMVVAAQLMKIKARMLLPRPSLDEQGEVVDPRTELVDRLLEYQRYKAAQAELERLEAEHLARFPRGAAHAENQELLSLVQPEDERLGLSLYSLLKVYKRLLERHSALLAKPSHVIRAYPYQPEQIRSLLQERLRGGRKLAFMDLVMEQPNRVFLVFCLLAVLDLLHQRRIRVIVGHDYNQFWVVEAPESNGTAGQDAGSGADLA